MAKLTPAEFREKQARNLKNSIPDIVRGINAVTENPMTKAANASGKWATNTAAAEPKWKARIGAVTMESWKKAAIEKGTVRIASGIDAAAPKVEAFAAVLLPFIDDLKKRVDAMPSASLEDSISRSAFWIREMYKLNY